MKTKIVLLIFGLSISISSCIYMVKSLHPFYKHKDITFNKDILGTWTDTDSSKWIFNQHKYKESFIDINEVNSNTYELIVKDSTDGDSYFNVCLFTIKRETYLDFYPVMDKMPGKKLADWHMIPIHSLAKLKIWTNSNISFFWYGEEWFNNLRKVKKLKISYETIKIGDKEDEEMNILTASTENLQKFVVKSGKEKIYDNVDIGRIKSLNDPEEIMKYVQAELEKKEDIPFPEGIKNAMVVNLRKINEVKNE